MRVLVTDTTYPRFLRDHYTRHPGLANASYGKQFEAVMRTFFGTSDAYAGSFGELGHETVNHLVNCLPLQLAWAREHGHARWTRSLRARLPTRLGVAAQDGLLRGIADAQIAVFDPDVVFVQNMFSMSPAALSRLRAEGRLVVTQIASPLPDAAVYRGYDLILSSFKHFVTRFRAEGIDSEYLRLAFDERVLDVAGGCDAASSRSVDVAFVGGVDPRVHTAGTAFLEQVAGHVPLDVWGYGAESLRRASPLLERYHGEAWGLAMYGVLADSRIALNRHIDVAEGQANNMRLYEATGAGALLMTEAAPNLGELFEPGREVIAYESANDLIDKLEWFLEHEDERSAVAHAGQQRTLREHTYAERMGELAELLEARLSRVASSAGVAAPASHDA